MKKFVNQLVILAAIGVSAGAMATSSYTGKITKIHSGPSVGPKVFLSIAGAKNVSVSEPCDDHVNYSYVFDASTEAGKVTLTMAMAAYAADKEVYLGGYETCTLYTGVEDLKWLRVQ